MMDKATAELHDAVNATIRDLIGSTVDISRNLITVYMFGKEIELSISELQSRRTSCRDFISYIKDEVGGKINIDENPIYHEKMGEPYICYGCSWESSVKRTKPGQFLCNVCLKIWENGKFFEVEQND